MFANGHDFHSFVNDVTGNYRFVHSDSASRFLANLINTSEHRVKIYSKDTLLWRAQIGSRIEAPGHEEAPLADLIFGTQAPHLPERMKPLPNAANEGRVNPKGIPCLYLSDDPNTAMAEVRPWLGVYVSLALLRIVRDLRLIDCSLHTERYTDFEAYFGNKGPDKLVEAIWSLVDLWFSKPVVEDPATAEYVPTQVMAESFKQAGYDGLIYRSRIGQGLNMALFNLADAEVQSVDLHVTEHIAHTFARATY